MALVTVPRGVIGKRLAFASLTNLDITQSLEVRAFVSRTQYRWVNTGELVGGSSDANLYDPDGFVSTDRWSLVIPATGNYMMHLSINQRVNGALQEIMVMRNDNPALRNGVEVVEANRILYLNFPRNTGLNTARVYNDGMCVVHLDEGDTLYFGEGGASANIMEGLSWTLEQLDEEPNSE